MPTFEWSDISDRHRSAILSQDAEARQRGISLRQFSVQPVLFDPRYEARELQNSDCGAWTMEFIDWAGFNSFSNAPRPIRFGSGAGFQEVPEQYRPAEPILLKLFGLNPELGFANSSGRPAIALVWNSLLMDQRTFDLVNRFEPIAEKRILECRLHDVSTGEELPYLLFDPARLDESDIDYDSSHMIWRRPAGWDGSKPENHLWGGGAVKFGAVFKPDLSFHLRRHPANSRIFISKDLIFTMYQEGIDLVSAYVDPHEEIYGHKYSPRNLTR
ncbi:MAG: hypothetical protein CMK07_03695 [Ponticaulis sp.]|nr:hypothetical protein [Ponticaulis sp.]